MVLAARPAAPYPGSTLLRLIPLLLWLPLAKWALPPGPARMLFFYGAGSLLAWVLWRQMQRRMRSAPLGGVALFARPLRGLGEGAAAFALLVAAGTVVHGALGGQMGALAGLLALPGAEGWRVLADNPGVAAYIVAGSVAEEWIFRVVLVWGGLARLGLLPGADGRDALSARRLLAAAALLLVVNAYFTLLHLPHSPLVLAQAFAGGVALSLWLLWRRNAYGIALLHALFNLTLWMNAGVDAL